MLSKFSVVALVAALANAQSLVFDDSSNPITRPLNEVYVPTRQ